MRGAGVDHEKWHPSVVGGTLTEKIERVQVPKQPSFCYSKNKMVNVYMALKNSNRLILPEAVDRSDPSLFADEDQPDVLQVLVGQHKPGPGGDQQHPGSDQVIPPHALCTVKRALCELVLNANRQRLCALIVCAASIFSLKRQLPDDLEIGSGRGEKSAWKEFMHSSMLHILQVNDGGLSWARLGRLEI